VKKKGPLTPEAFNRLLLWLGPDLEKAADKYELIRFKLMKIFARRGCHVPDELADETMDRVGLKVQQIAESYTGDKSLYFYGVAKNVFREYLDEMTRDHLNDQKGPPVSQQLPDPAEHEQQDRRHECLENCLAKLRDQDREFILRYFQGDKGDRIDNRRKMGESHGLTIEAVRMRAHRIMSSLKRCVRNCVAEAL
jgi:RNA polymerase sigma factor (sigma-70 family)